MVRPDDVLALSFARDAQVSPDGRSIAFTVSSTPDRRRPETSTLFIQNVGSRNARQISRADAFAEHPRWSPDGRSLAFGLRDAGGSALWIHDVDTRTDRQVALDGGSAEGPCCWSPDGRRLAFAVLFRVRRDGVRRISSRIYRADGLGFLDDERQDIFVVEAGGGSARPYVTGHGTCSRPAWSPGGRSLLYLATTEPIPFSASSPGVFVLDEMGKVRTVTDSDWYVSAAGWGVDDDDVIVAGDYRSKVGVPGSKLWRISGDGDVQCLTPDLRGNVGTRVHHDMPIWGSEGTPFLVRGTDIIVNIQRGGTSGLVRSSLTTAPSWEVLAEGDRCCFLTSASDRGDRIAFLATDITNPTDVFTCDPSDGTERRITDLNRSISSQWRELACEPISITSDDGLEIEGWVLHKRVARMPAPAILYIHGGPYIAAGHFFRFDLVMLAAHGFSVVFSNFRGSLGYGDDFSLLVKGDPGGELFRDHMATIDRAIELGFADERRLGVWGPSHGGLATCWVVTHTPRFRAAIAEAAVTNHTTFYYLADVAHDGREFGGKPHEVPEVYAARSPITHVAACSTPTLMLHGEDDLRCPIEQAEEFHRALLDVGCVSEMVRIPDCDHLGDSCGPPEARVAQNETLLEWFTRWL